jgi:hypothetical protein
MCSKLSRTGSGQGLGVEEEDIEAGCFGTVALQHFLEHNSVEQASLAIPFSSYLKQILQQFY